MYQLPADCPSDAFAAFAHLKSRTSLTIEDMQVLAMIESYGEAFYMKLAEGIADTEARRLLERNAAEERGHAHRLLKAISLKGGASFALPDRGDNPFFVTPPVAMDLTADLVAALEAGEIDGDLTYQAWADAEPNAEVADLLRLNGREETRHSERVNAVKQRLLAA